MEAHDALLFCIPIFMKEKWIPIIKEEMERPIDFSRCTLRRHELSIPCDIEVGKNYMEMRKFKDIPIIAKPAEMLSLIPKSITEQFTVVNLRPDSKLSDIIYNNAMKKLTME
jgi:hypothetical protein